MLLTVPRATTLCKRNCVRRCVPLLCASSKNADVKGKLRRKWARDMVSNPITRKLITGRRRRWG